jgi:hypothetical protein
MSLNSLLIIDGLELALPCYFARVGNIALLLQLLDDKVLTFTACNVTSEDIWEHLTISKSDIPLLCTVMEHFGAALQGPCSYNLVQWIESNRMLSGPLTAELSGSPCRYPHLARAVVDATPIHSQAVIIAAKHGFVDWLEAETGHLATVRPEGYKSWRALSEYLTSQGGIDAPVSSCLSHLAASAEDILRRQAALRPYLSNANANAPGNKTKVPSSSCSTGSTTQREFRGLLRAFADGDVDGVVEHLCSANPADARTVLEDWIEQVPMLVAVHHGFTDLVDTYIQRDPDSAVKHLCLCDPAQTRRIVENNMIDCRFIGVAVHHGFTDLLDGFNKRDSKGNIIAPAWSPTSPYYLSPDNGKNAWMWLIKGDGDVDGKVWAAMEAQGLVSDAGGAATLLCGVYQSGAKVARDVIGAMVNKYPTVLHCAAQLSLDAVKSLVEAGANAGFQDSHGYVPLHLASDAAIAQYLVESKADPSTTNTDGYTPLKFACECDNFAVAAYLSSIGARE